MYKLQAIRVGGGPLEGLQLGGGLEPDRVGRRGPGALACGGWGDERFGRRGPACPPVYLSTLRNARVHRSVLGGVPARVGRYKGRYEGR